MSRRDLTSLDFRGSSGRVLRSTRLRVIVFGAALAAMLTVAWGYASGDSDLLSIFRRFRDDDGLLQSLPAPAALNIPGLNAANTFFQTSLGTNGQSCATCHAPSDGFTIHVTTIQNAFDASNGQDPLFRFNDTANNPNSRKNNSTNVDDLKQAYSLILALGVMRIGEVLPLPPPAGTAEFTVAPQNSRTFGTLPMVGTDPQHPATATTTPVTLSLFRRPLVTSNMRFDSSVLWNARANLSNIRAQVNGASRTLLLAGGINGGLGPTNAQLDDVATFMLGTFTDEVVDDRSSAPPSFAGSTSAAGALGGTKNLVKLSVSPDAPCLFDATGALTHTGTPAVTYYPAVGPTTLTPPTCTPVTPGGPNMTTFAAWANIPPDNTTDISRRQIAHGEEVFNTAVLHIDVHDSSEVLRRANRALAAQLGTTEIHCTTCHATNNIGNHPNATFTVRIGSDSVRILKALDRQNPNLDNFVTRTQMLPQYCLRNTAGPSLDSVRCGEYEGSEDKGIPGDEITSDPGRAMQTGKWADIGKFKPPILRNLAVRSPYFHGSAADSTVGIIEFYDTRFKIGLTQTEKDDLVRFVEAH